MERFRVEFHGRVTSGWSAGSPGGRVALFLHGVPTSSMLWSRLSSYLPDAYLIAPDLPGYGDSDPFPCPDLEHHAQWLKQLVGRLGLPFDTLHLVGHDLGGLIAANHAACFGCASLTLTSAPVGLLWSIPRLTAIWPLHRYFYERHGGAIYLRHGIHPLHREAFLSEFQSVLERRNLASYMRATARGIPLSYVSRLPRLLGTTRTLCLWGGSDPFLPRFTAWWTARRLGARLRSIEDGRHYVPFGQPEFYARELQAFWESEDRDA